MKVCICGGGNLGLVCTGYLGSQKGIDVVVYTGNPSLWQSEIEVVDPSNHTFLCHPSVISDNAGDLIPHSDMILLCLPGFALESTLKKILPYITEGTVIGSVVCNTGFFFLAHEILPVSIPLFGFQRAPFIARTVDYGRKARLLGYKNELKIAVEGVQDCEKFRKDIETLFSTPTRLLNNFYEASLSNSNPILHTGRLFSMWGNWDGEVFDKQIMFYKEWTNEASQLVLDMDSEFMRLPQSLGISENAIPSLLKYYESTDAESLTRKIRSISAFESIAAPMCKVRNGWVPDFKSRYFTEDFPFGLKYIVSSMEKQGLRAEILNKVLSWGMDKCDCSELK